MKRKKILYILSGNLSTTPRALKSILIHPEKVEILIVSRTPYWESRDHELARINKLDFKRVNLYRKPFLIWLRASLKHQLYRLLYPLLKRSIKANAFASEKASILLSDFLSVKTDRYSAIVGHGYGALYPAWSFSRKTSSLFFFDMEDYHPGELIRKDAQSDRKRREFLISRLLPDSTGVSFSSPLIQNRTLALSGPLQRPVTILNSFPASEFTDPDPGPKPLKLIWFSQKITLGRGLEEIIEALLNVDADWELTLIGDPDEQFLNRMNISRSERIRIHDPMPQEELHQGLSDYHMGLALEIAVDENKSLCISNKMIAYAQAGLYILASNTPAQTDFIAEDPERGIVTEMNKDKLITTIQHFIANKDAIHKHRDLRYKNANSLSWELESEKLKKLFKI